MFGNVFERPLKLPWGFGAALKFMKYVLLPSLCPSQATLMCYSFVDPTLEQDLASSSKPWALSPLIATMPYLEHKKISGPGDIPSFPPEHLVGNDMSHLHLECAKKTDLSKDRRTVFKDVARRKEVVFGSEVCTYCTQQHPLAYHMLYAQDLITADFCYNYLRFSSQGVELCLPGGLTIDMMKYWDGQPVPFVCCERLRPGEHLGQPWGRILWCVVIEAVDEDEGLDVNGEDID